MGVVIWNGEVPSSKLVAGVADRDDERLRAMRERGSWLKAWEVPFRRVASMVVKMRRIAGVEG